MVEAFIRQPGPCAGTPALGGSVVAIMALGIGACTAMFSIITAVFFDPLPVIRAMRVDPATCLRAL